MSSYAKHPVPWTRLSASCSCFPWPRVRPLFWQTWLPALTGVLTFLKISATHAGDQHKLLTFLFIVFWQVNYIEFGKWLLDSDCHSFRICPLWTISASQVLSRFLVFYTIKVFFRMNIFIDSISIFDMFGGLTWRELINIYETIVVDKEVIIFRCDVVTIVMNYSTALQDRSCTCTFRRAIHSFLWTFSRSVNSLF